MFIVKASSTIVGNVQYIFNAHELLQKDPTIGIELRQQQKSKQRKLRNQRRTLSLHKQENQINHGSHFLPRLGAHGKDEAKMCVCDVGEKEGEEERRKLNQGLDPYSLFCLVILAV